jgi:WD40 repeat protein
MTASGRTVRLWSGSGELLRDYPPHPSTVADVQRQPNELFFATAAYGQLATFGPEVIEPAKRFAWKGSILTIAWSPDGSYIATGNQDASVHFWYWKTGRHLEISGYPAKGPGIELGREEQLPGHGRGGHGDRLGLFRQGTGGHSADPVGRSLHKTVAEVTRDDVAGL